MFWIAVFIVLCVIAFGLLYVQRWKRRQAREAAPDWARIFTPARYKAFNSAVELALLDLGLEAARRGGVVAAADDQGRPLRFGLQNLAQQCRQVEPDRWPELMAAHFRAVMNAEAEAGAVDKADFEAVRGLLKVRLLPTQAVENHDELEVVQWSVAEGLVAVLVYDLPNTVASVPTGDLTAWDRTREELYELGLENVRAEAGMETDRLEVDGGVVLRALEGESFFVASHLLLLEHQLPQKLPYGALVSAPTRHNLIFHAIRDSRVLVAINAMIPQSYTLFHQGPGSLSPNLYWWHDDELTLLPTSLETDAVKFTPPAVFVQQVMNPLAEE